jgi:glutathione reductase (NADPH)
MFNASATAESLHNAKEFGFEIDKIKFDWSKIKSYRDRYIGRLNKIYEDSLDKTNVTRIQGMAKFKDKNTVIVNDNDLYSANHIVVAVGGAPTLLDIPGEVCYYN